MTSINGYTAVKLKAGIDGEAELAKKLNRSKENINRLRVAINSFADKDRKQDYYENTLQKERSLYTKIALELARVRKQKSKELRTALINNSPKQSITDESAQDRLKRRSLSGKLLHRLSSRSTHIDAIVF